MYVGFFPCVRHQLHSCKSHLFWVIKCFNMGIHDSQILREEFFLCLVTCLLLEMHTVSIDKDFQCKNAHIYFILNLQISPEC